MKQLWVFLLFLSPLGAIADVWLPAIFSNDMVLQQQSSVTVWGWAQPGEKVKVTGSWLGESINTVTNENAVWKLTITTPKAGGPHTLSIEGRNKIVLQNVMVGEVWLCAGQSNMEWSAEHGVKDAKAELPTAYNANIRFFKMPKLTAETPQTDTKGKWAICDSSTLKRFSAVGYFFGKKLTQSLNVPIGLIDVAWGGSYIESWIPEHIVNMFPNTRISAETMIPSKGWPRQAGYIYNGMVAPITPFNIAGHCGIRVNQTDIFLPLITN